jgi:hypothetical protein
MTMTTKTTTSGTVEQETLGVEQESSFLPATTSDATPASSNALAALNADDEWAGVDSGDLSGGHAGRIPLLALNRKMGGGFVDAETGEKREDLHLIWLARMTSRAWWSQPFSGKDSGAPECRSFDGITSDPQSPQRQAEKCAGCPMAQWKDGDPPACKESVEAMVYIPDDLDTGRLARIRFGGIAVAPARAYWDSFSARLPKRPPMAFVTHVQLEPFATDNGDFLKPRFSRVAELSRADAEPLIAERQRRIDDWRSDIEDSVKTQRAEDEPANGKADSEDSPATTVYTDGDEPF